MDLTISMNTVLNFLHSMSLSTSNKQWLADQLYEEVKAEKKAAIEQGQNQTGLIPSEREQAQSKVKAAATTHNGWPKIRREDMRISPEVANLVKGFELPEDADYDQLKLEYLMKKHG